MNSINVYTVGITIRNAEIDSMHGIHFALVPASSVYGFPFSVERVEYSTGYSVCTHFLLPVREYIRSERTKPHFHIQDLFLLYGIQYHLF